MGRKAHPATPVRAGAAGNCKEATLADGIRLATVRGIGDDREAEFGGRRPTEGARGILPPMRKKERHAFAGMALSIV